VIHMRRNTKQLLKRILPVIAVFLAINIGFGIELYLRYPKEWFTPALASQYNSLSNPIYNASTHSFAVNTAEKIVYMSYGTNLLILDVTDINNPTVLSNFNKTNTARYVAQEDDLLVITSFKDFNVLNVSNPSMPQNLSDFNIHVNYTISDVQIVDQIVYLAVSPDSTYVELPGSPFRALYIVNVSDPYNPVEMAVYSQVGLYTSDLTVYKDVVYLSQANWGTSLINVNNKSHPVKYSPGSYTGFGLVENLPYAVAVRKTVIRDFEDGRYIFVADADNGYIIGDVTNPNQPQPIDGVFLNNVVSIHLFSDYAFLVNNTGHGNLYSLKKPLKFDTVGSFSFYISSAITRDIVVHQATWTIYLLRNNGLAIYRLIEGRPAKNSLNYQFYREETKIGYTWIGIALSFIICVPLAITVILRHQDQYTYKSRV